MEEALRLSELLGRVSRLIQVPATQNVWVTAELSDVQVRRGHCYFEMIEKQQGIDAPVAKIRGRIWASAFGYISAQFQSVTGQFIASGIKVMMRGSVEMHPVYGMAFNVTAINPEYTLGDMVRRRMEILARLKSEGIIDMNRQLQWAEAPLRIAVISSPGAAGYGDFINQLYNNEYRLRFRVKLFDAMMQGENAVPSVISALEAIADEMEQWDGVVIIRGGGSTSELAVFDNYDLAANVAQFPLPIIVGIGHERDVTVLDDVANMRVKTPTAAAEWLISRGGEQLAYLDSVANRVLQSVTDLLSGHKESLARVEELIKLAPISALERSSASLREMASRLSVVSSRQISQEIARLDSVLSGMPALVSTLISRQRERVDACAALLDAISPQATLRRGYSITRVGGRVVSSSDGVADGAVIETTLAQGILTSINKK